MANAQPPSPEAQKKPTLTESVESLIARKKAEKETEKTTEGYQKVQESAAKVQAEVSEVMAGVEKPHEGITEKREKKSDQVSQKSGGGGQDQDSGGAAAMLGAMSLPDEEVMIKKVRTAIELQIQMEWKKAKKLQKNLQAGSAQEYNAVIARIRSLKQILSSLVIATFQYIKGLYLKYFTPEGKQRPIDEIKM